MLYASYGKVLRGLTGYRNRFLRGDSERLWIDFMVGERGFLSKDMSSSKLPLCQETPLFWAQVLQTARQRLAPSAALENPRVYGTGFTGAQNTITDTWR